MPWLNGLVRHISIWRQAWRAETQAPKRQGKARHEMEFLPAVLELQETPASPIGRTIGFIVITLFSVALVWAYFGKIDIVAVAQGKIIPSGHAKIIQPLEAGTISVIHVEDGQKVAKGDVLIEFDGTDSGADYTRLNNEKMAAQVEAARLRALIAGNHRITAPAGIDQELVANAEQTLADQLQEYTSNVESAQSLIDQRKAAIEQTEINITRLQQVLPVMEERLKAYEDMYQKEYGSKIQYLELKEEHINKIQDLGALQQQRIQEMAALKEAQTQHQALIAEFNSRNKSELALTETKIKSYEQELIKANNRSIKQKLLSPIDGVVQELSIHTIGGVVTPAQKLLVLVPAEEQLEIEAWVENKDIGFVNENDNAEIKVEAFPFTKYGTISGTIKTLSQAAVPLENVGLVFHARVSMERNIVQVQNKLVELTPGMNVTVEIKTGTRRIIEYFLAPLLRGINESIRER
ncbi:MAG: HlyD family type I secretion periplasmic adaptor subunit [Gammaproteobacteria bacterium]